MRRYLISFAGLAGARGGLGTKDDFRIPNIDSGGDYVLCDDLNSRTATQGQQELVPAKI